MAPAKSDPSRLTLHARKRSNAVSFLAVCGLALLATPSAHADDAASVDQLNKQALEAFDSLNFDQAKALLEKAVVKGEAAGLEHDPALARTHLDLGMVLIAGFQKRDEAIAHFKTALTIAPDVSAPAGLFNPEVQAAFDEAKQQVETEKEAEKKLAQPRRPVRPPVVVKPTETAEEEQGEEEEEEESVPGSGFFLSVGVGSGAGIARGKLDTNTDLAQNGTGNNTWSGGLAASRLGHVTADVGFFVSKDLLLSIEGRLQIINGTTPVTIAGSSRSPPSTAFAATAKATYFLASGPLRPFLSGGIGGGSVREVVKLNVTPAPADPSQTTHCGSSGNEPTCVDTVTGGPLLLAVGTGIAYQLGSVDLLASLTSNIGIPKFMINVDLTLGLGFRL